MEKTGVMKTTRCILLLLITCAFSGCLSMLAEPPSQPTAAEDVGPKPTNIEWIVANWGNRNYPARHAYTAEEFSIPDPKPIVYNEPLLGRKVGWQVMIGPENRRLANDIGYAYTRLIIHGDRIISTVSSSSPFQDPQ